MGGWVTFFHTINSCSKEAERQRHTEREEREKERGRSGGGRGGGGGGRRRPKYESAEGGRKKNPSMNQPTPESIKKHQHTQKSRVSRFSPLFSFVAGTTLVLALSHTPKGGVGWVCPPTHTIHQKPYPLPPPSPPTKKKCVWLLSTACLHATTATQGDSRQAHEEGVRRPPKQNKQGPAKTFFNATL